MIGKIIKSQKELYYVDTNDMVYKAKARGNFRVKDKKPLVGDNVEIEILEERHSAVIYTNQESEQAIEKVIELLSNEEELRTMGIRMRSLQTPHAVNTIISNLDIWRD